MVTVASKAAAAAVTAREREVWSLVEAHLTNSQIADTLCLSVRTVESHVSSLMRKLGVADRRTLARLAPRSGVGSDDSWPPEVTTFIGRERERVALVADLGRHRMVTVTGPGGVGKTRLVINVVREVAAARRDGGLFVDLVAVSDPDQVVAAAAAAAGVAEQPGRSLSEAVTSALRGSDAVLVLDNCEHVLDSARTLTELLLRSCPSLMVVATSRVRFAAPFEWVVEVPGLFVTEDGGDGVQLFLERAAAALGGRPATIDRRQVSALCRSLDGSALAIELAAGRYPSLGLDGLRAGLRDRLRYLTTGARLGDRHRSLATAIAWSFDLLSDADRSVLIAVSVFASWFDVDAAQAVVEPTDSSEVADALARLVDHHLLVAAPGQPTRYRALESIRQFADARLTVPEPADTVHARHRQWCLDQLAELAGQAPDDAWCRRLDRLADDARAALTWAADQGMDPDASRVGEQLGALLLLRGQLEEAQRRYEQAADRAEPVAEQVRLLRLAAGVAAARVTGNDTLRLLEAAADRAAAAGDHLTAASCQAWMVIYCTMMPGIIAVLPDPAEATGWLELASAVAPHSPAVEVAVAAALPVSDQRSRLLAEHAADAARRQGQPLEESVALDQLCSVHLARHDLGGAVALLRRRGDVLDALPLDASTAYQFNDYLLMASEVHLAAGDLASAARYADRLAGLACYREQAHLATSRRIKVDALAGGFDSAIELGDRFLAAWTRAGRPLARTLNVTCAAVAMAHGLLGDQRSRARWLGITRTLTLEPDDLLGFTTGWAPTFDALVLLDSDQPSAAVQRLSADIDDAAVWGTWSAALWRPWYAALWVEAAVLTGAEDAQDRLDRGSDPTRQNPIAATIVQRAAAYDGGDLDGLAACTASFADLGCRYQQRRTLRLLEQLGA